MTSHGDGSIMKYGGNAFGHNVTQKQMPAGVACEQLEDFNSKPFANSSPPTVSAMISGKDLTSVYEEWKRQVLKQQGFVGSFSLPKVATVVDAFQPQFNAKGVNLFLCNVRTSTGTMQGQGVQFVYWFEYVDTTQQQDYVPAENMIPHETHAAPAQSHRSYARETCRPDTPRAACLFPLLPSDRAQAQLAAVLHQIVVRGGIINTDAVAAEVYVDSPMLFAALWAAVKLSVSEKTKKNIIQGPEQQAERAVAMFRGAPKRK
eukprot:CAMPEP_0181316974 /NCGR_PEP_ID=MMETSP1101-20121128/16181_1 /TAXON_ID=46948 /ORGANISM="Rhodomonas abbreviata, Strain Caron Lab Isolate" /LENGTH=260 /DNA_ID=CAMNT_0023424257 /DNA_START=53 /DNA_END=837 /DNA_ORIENTATION=+